MITHEKYGPITLSIIDQGGSDGLKEFAYMFGSLLLWADEDRTVQLTSKAGPNTFEVGLLFDGELVGPERVGLDRFIEAFENRDHPVAGWVDQETLDSMRSTLMSLYGG